tara:strand:- start:915 stop:2183 length:1269 start_codon:yes stop_codon:yes gene_type:complete
MGVFSNFFKSKKSRWEAERVEGHEEEWRKFQADALSIIDELNDYMELEYPEIGTHYSNDKFHLNKCKACGRDLSLNYRVPKRLKRKSGTVRFYHDGYCDFDFNATLEELHSFFQGLIDYDLDIDGEYLKPDRQRGIYIGDFLSFYLRSSKSEVYLPHGRFTDERGFTRSRHRSGTFYDAYGDLVTVRNRTIKALAKDFQGAFDLTRDQAIIEELYDPFHYEKDRRNAYDPFDYGKYRSNITAISDSNGNRTIRFSGGYLMQAMNWEQFEILAMHLLRFQGWDAQLSEREALFEGSEPTSDGGVDVIGTKGDRKVFLQAKHYLNVEKKVGRPVVQQIYGAAAMASATDVIVATSGEFTEFAVSAAKTQDMNEAGQFMKLELWDQNKMIKMIDELSDEDYLILEQIVDPDKDPKVWIKPSQELV